MPKILESKSLYYNDINLIAQPSKSFIGSRKEINVDLHRIIVSPMEAVVGEKFAIEALNSGLTVCFPRFNSIEQQKKSIHNIYDACGKENIEGGWKDLFLSVGLNDWERVESIEHKSILIEVANGYLKEVIRFAWDLRQKGYRVMVGNVHSAKGINLYPTQTLVRIGIGQGSVCKTGSVSGYTRGQVTEILECYESRDAEQKIIADGGIKDSGFAAKAFLLGADYVMMGGYFKCAEEAQNIVNGEFRYWGGASKTQQLKAYGEIRRLSEGTEVKIERHEIKPLKQLISDLKDGLQSAISYSGHQNLIQSIGNGVFEVKHNSLIK